MLLRHLLVQALCVRNQVVFNSAKFKFGRREVDFAVVRMTNEGVKLP